MDTKFFRIVLIIFSLSLLQSCPRMDDEVCNEPLTSATIPDLITITPLKTIYSQGEVVIYKIIIPSQNNYFSNSVDLHAVTGVNEARYAASSTQLFDGNTVTYLKGNKNSAASNWHNLIYNPATNNYELEIKVGLNKIGDYAIYSDDFIDFSGTPKCNRYFIETNILGDANHYINFKVQ